MKVLVTGANGQLGTDVMAVLAQRGMEAVGTDVDTLDLTNAAAVRALLAAELPDAVIHCAAFTDVNAAEQARERCFAVNEGATRNVAAACNACGAKLLYTSTDYVFGDNGTAFLETDAEKRPCNVYGASKLAGELAVQALCSRAFIVRISWVFGLHGKNFVKTMLRLSETHDTLRVVDDQIGSPTYTADLAPLLVDMVCSERYGIYHATNEGVCSWAEFAAEIFRQAGRPTAVEPVPSADYPSPAVRPLNSRLSKASLDAASFARLPDWRDALRRFLSDL
ncbi:MAG: dTDP-4-dehydrorhamnose reductase [Clostridia bacterium]|nr:dTDP-4-dehydrorhamnose reductase [Clostridia bacterium]